MAPSRERSLPAALRSHLPEKGYANGYAKGGKSTKTAHFFEPVLNSAKAGKTADAKMPEMIRTTSGMPL